jgi:hypothetical protein
VCRAVPAEEVPQRVEAMLRRYLAKREQGESLTDNGTEVRWLPSSFAARVPSVAALTDVVATSAGFLACDAPTQTLTVHGKLNEDV